MWVRMCVWVFAILPVVLTSDSASPQIIEHPVSVTVTEGSPATLHCRVSPPSNNIQWVKDGSLLPEREGVLALPEGSLFFLSPRARDGGVYECRVKISGSSLVRSRTARLTVNYLRHQFGLVEERMISVREGDRRVELPCSPPRGRPHPRVTWEKEGKVLELGEGRQVRKEGSLVIEEVTLEDGGTYTCLATSSQGEVRDEPIELTVEKKIESISTHEVILIERQEEELSLRVWMVAIALAVTVTVSLLAIILMVIIRYRSLTLLPTSHLPDTEPDSSSSSTASGHRLLRPGDWGSHGDPHTGLSPSLSPTYSRVQTEPGLHYVCSNLITGDYSRPYSYGGRGPSLGNPYRH